MRSAFTLRVVGLAATLMLVAACSSSASKSASETTAADSTTSSSVEESSTTSSLLDASTTTASSVTATTAPAAPTTKAPAPTSPPTPAPTSPPAPAGPKITSFSITGPTSCPATDVSVSLPPVPVKLTWTATGADSVYIAIGNPDGPYETGLPLTGSYELPSPCPGPFSQTYYIVAVKGAQKDVKSKTISSNS